MADRETSGAVKADRILIAVLPIGISVIAYFVIQYICKKYGFEITSDDGIEDYKIMLSIWGTLLGFLITAVSILLTIGEGRFLNMLKATGHYQTILYSYVICCVHLLLVLILAIVCVFIKIWTMALFAILCSAVIDTVLRVGICLFFLFVIVLRANDR
ncbi:hypothetical protein ACQRCQ_02810 [Lachnospiraceae bacterium SGI.085]|jgi:hypothetical protein|nr:hypothetical protein [Lachnospira sp.]MDY6156765.1 hypothetical protein [Agathobacter sp.]DAZ33613.1 MAG TPA: hypothetical protein [Caudoviricetes sp.]